MNLLEAVKYKNDNPDREIYRSTFNERIKFYLTIDYDEILSGGFPLDLNDFYSSWHEED